MSSSDELLITFWEDQRRQAQRSEDQRAVFANIVLTISAIGFGFIAQNGATSATLPISCGLVLLGLYGAVASAKLHERYRLHMRQSAGFAVAMEELHPGLDLEAARRRGRDIHDKQHPWLRRIRLNLIWVSLHLSISAGGAILVVVSLR
ncbi:hypothetical protein [Micromonospora sp. NPDC085948]|uniref:hypothetical protein n=1 Tax=Micromonospora sp. NPDC085948 TaxID=3155293 RepID=UPI003447B563